VAIAKLDLGGNRVAGFGNNGVVLSTQSGIASFAGLELMGNGDIVVAYSGFTGGNVNANDFYIEVFHRDGTPKTIRTITIPGAPPTVIELNWAGSQLICANRRGREGSDLVVDNVVATALVKSPDESRITVIGNYDTVVTDDFSGVEHVRTTWTGSMRFGGPSTNYGQDFNFGGYCPEDDQPGGSTFVTQWGAGGFTVRASDDPDTIRRPFYPRAAAWYGNELWMVGHSYAIEGSFPTFDIRRLGSVTNAGAAGCGTGAGFGCDNTYGGWAPMNFAGAWSEQFALTSSYWDARQTFFNSITRQSDGVGLVAYGHGESAFYPGGNYQMPLISESDGAPGFTRQARWMALNPLLSTSSADVMQGLPFDGKHVLLGALRYCFEGNHCSGVQDRFFVAMTGGAHDGFQYPPNALFGYQGSAAYWVPSYNGLDAPRAWALAGVMPDADPGEARNLVVVGDFRPNGISDPNDFDWFITRVRLRGANGTLQALRFGGGGGSIVSSPSGILCSPTCVATFPPDIEVTLTATPAPGAVFSGWATSSNCASTSGNICRVRIDGEQAVGAIFVANPEVLFQNGFE